ncbi:oligoendopeptidase [Pontibacillus halophilus JSM 076056 = DSM 19796]|uniref:Oligoendopeptidase n=2 Tax=Pontibacillus TaxID=289201 RepID=A0A0A5GFK9_9BACI|nr:M3 family oligoendopeptidase [Pontibacillus halophilus]KGX91986.1 oligoendopeptidase [Pontibacillus halophilus JSM 076056 = DSM 19796]
MSNTTYSMKWDLDSIFPGGSESKEFAAYLDKLQLNVHTLNEKVTAFVVPEQASDSKEFEEILQLLQTVYMEVSESGSFIACLVSQDVSDKKAQLLQSKISQQFAEIQNVTTLLEQKVTRIADDVWNEILQQPFFERVQFVLDEMRTQGKEKLPLEQETLINDLSVDGYHAWEDLYDRIVAKISITIEEDGEEKTLSFGQASNKLSDTNRDVREDVHYKLQKAWKDQEDLTSETLNHLAGFRLQKYKHRGWKETLKEPLQLNRMSQETLDTMWKAIENQKHHFVKYLDRKANLLGVERLAWYDQDAPIASSQSTVSYDEGADFIVKHFNRFGPQMAEFAQKAFNEKWIEAEDRAGKRPGGFCTSFNDSKQTRIFMTYSGTPSNVSTLAHELGHAFHQYVMDDMEYMNQSYAMNVAETASTFAEMIVADASVKEASSKEEKIALLEDKLQRSVAFFMNIHARFLFETRFYEERKEGFVPAERLNQLMEEAQQEAYQNALSEYEPEFWASKLHFHITGVPFYNFPYTFGYLFSLGIYAEALKSGEEFEQNYISLLRDTGRMSVEDLAKKHLNVDLQQSEFWEAAIQLCVKDVEEFIELTN